MAFVIPAAFTLTSTIFGTLNGISAIFIGMRKCYKGFKKIGGLVDRGEASLKSIEELAKQVAVFVQSGAVSMETFCLFVQRCDQLKEELEELNTKLKRKHRRIYNFFSATEKVLALERICGKLARIESDMRQLIPAAEVKTHTSALLEMMDPLLKAAAAALPGDDSVEKQRQILSNLRQAYGTQVLCSDMNRMITGTGSAEAAYNYVMGLSYFIGIKVKQDYARSLRYFEDAVRCGNTESYYYLGKLYEKGRGVRRNRKQAFRMFERGVNHGYASCLAESGRLLVHGIGCEKNVENGIKRLKSAGDLGNISAHYLLGRYFLKGTSKDEIQAVYHFKSSAEAGHIRALHEYATCWMYGMGVEMNKRYGITLMEAAAKRGSVYAMGRLGHIYSMGSGVKKDLSTAFRWYSEAAYRGRQYAKYQAGKRLVEGKGVERDVSKGVALLMNGGNGGNHLTLNALARYYRRGIGVAMNKKKALQLYHRSEKKPENMFALGQMYKGGEGCRRNYSKAIHYFTMSLQGSHQYSLKGTHLELAKIFESAEGFINPNRALYHLRIVADLRNDEGSNRRVAQYFVRSSCVRKMSFTHHEFQVSLDKIRAAHSRNRINPSMTVGSIQIPPAVDTAVPRVLAALTSPLENCRPETDEVYAEEAVPQTLTSPESETSDFSIPEGCEVVSSGQSIIQLQRCILALLILCLGLSSFMLTFILCLR